MSNYAKIIMFYLKIEMFETDSGTGSELGNNCFLEIYLDPRRLFYQWFVFNKPWKYLTFAWFLNFKLFQNLSYIYIFS